MRIARRLVKSAAPVVLAFTLFGCTHTAGTGIQAGDKPTNEAASQRRLQGPKPLRPMMPFLHSQCFLYTATSKLRELKPRAG